jgi:hypothetical protein
LSGFSGYIQNSSDILYAELYAIYKGLLLAKEMGITDFVCYSDSLHCINILKGPPIRFHAYVVLIQDIKELLEQGNVMLWLITPLGKEINVRIFLPSLVPLLMLSFFGMSLLR